VTTRNVLLIDLGIAILAALVVLTVTPGLAVAGAIAIVVLIMCGVSLKHDSRRRRKASAQGCRGRGR
jgi:Flp pilus assembly protein TadB